MRVLLDEAVPRRLGLQLVGHEVDTVVGRGWGGVKNGKLLALAAGQFDVFVTTDQNIEFQQNLSTLPIAILVIVARSNRMMDIEPLVGDLLDALRRTQPRSLSKVGQVVGG